MKTATLRPFPASQHSTDHTSFLSSFHQTPTFATSHPKKKQAVISITPTRPSRSLRSVRCAIRFRPCIDIHKGKVKQIVGSTLRDSADDGSSLITNFESDKSPAEFANLYKKDGLTGGHVIMLGADPTSKSAAIEALHAYPGGLQVGGGINSENALSYIEEGASHVIVTSDGRYTVVTDRWQKFSDLFLDWKTLDFLASYADEFLVHGVDVEGKRWLQSHLQHPTLVRQLAQTFETFNPPPSPRYSTEPYYTEETEEDQTFEPTDELEWDAGDGVGAIGASIRVDVIIEIL
ncbi:1-5-phosphoribosyl-5-5-phosphoribosylaminomethylideneamino imidazole-4-carboxamide isomerase, chloroplastic [Cinnamomum micranthum f. kanehirae]|uniref:1-5-phosphoribosyl-5-5-phosphoribosylaminomethylideneamino imidazole-4-carboxamide isomerase, chloroplastic n=1 Tax=Cinnamomum micranthum f. kanehirae TaxID=337451 RepID=A0A443NYG5_9MAGN|nr:1-5-phosphoribosyl-5-5-phosphoribosylaminomethylideneamino imidazole-4-carboxamide isomerase, chloroplastic [Cinnamomum micranthum f. kanehirae]